MNPMQLLKMKSAWDRFQAAHPKFPLFLNSVMQNGIHEGTILEFKVTEPDGRTFCSNLKISREDLELFQELKELGRTEPVTYERRRQACGVFLFCAIRHCTILHSGQSQ